MVRQAPDLPTRETKNRFVCGRQVVHDETASGPALTQDRLIAVLMPKEHAIAGQRNRHAIPHGADSADHGYQRSPLGDESSVRTPVIDPCMTGGQYALSRGVDCHHVFQFAGPFALSAAERGHNGSVHDRESLDRQRILGVDRVYQPSDRIDRSEFAESVGPFVHDFTPGRVVDLVVLLGCQRTRYKRGQNDARQADRPESETE